MIEEREVITLLLGVFAGVLAFRNRRSLSHVPAGRLLIGAAALLFFGFIVSILEGLFWETTFNAAEHVAYGTCSLLLALWVRLCFAPRASQRDPEV